MPAKKKRPRRVHDKSAYDLGFQAGYLSEPTHQMPEPPAHIRGKRALDRWFLGLDEGLDARDTRNAIRLEKAAEEAAREAQRYRRD